MPYSRSIDSSDFLKELKVVFAQYAGKNLGDKSQNKYLKPFKIKTLQALGITTISLNEVLAHSVFELIDELAPYPEIINELYDYLNNLNPLNYDKGVELGFLTKLINAFEKLSKYPEIPEGVSDMEYLAIIKKAHNDFKPLKKSINHLFRFLGYRQPILNSFKLTENSIDAVHYRTKLGNTINPTFLVSRGVVRSHHSHELRVDLDQQVTFDNAYFKNQISKFVHDYWAKVIATIVSIGEGANAWNGLFFLISPILAMRTAQFMTISLVLATLAGYCAQQVNKTLFYCNIKDTLDQFSKGIFKFDDGSHVKGFKNYAILGFAIGISLCAAFAITGILQFSSTLTLFNMLFASLPLNVQALIPSILPTVLSLSIAACSFVGFSAIFAQCFITKAKNYIHNTNPEVVTETKTRKVIPTILTVMLSSVAFIAHTFQCMKTIDVLPGIRDHALFCKILIGIAEIPLNFFFSSGISKFVNLSYDYLTNANNQEPKSNLDESILVPQVASSHEGKYRNQVNATEKASERKTLLRELPINSGATACMYFNGISGNLAAYSGISHPLKVFSSVAATAAVFAGSIGNNRDAILKKTEKREPVNVRDFATMSARYRAA